MDLKGRNFLKLLDYTPEEMTYLLDLAAELKAKKKKGIPVDTLRGKNVALIFEKTSTRTRCSFEVAAHDLGMERLTLIPPVLRSVRRRALQILPVCWEECMRVSSTVDMVRRSWKSWQNMQGFRYGTV